MYSLLSFNFSQLFADLIAFIFLRLSPPNPTLPL